MKYIIALIALIANIAQAELIPVSPAKVVGGQITAIEVGQVKYNADDNSWEINAQPVVEYPQPASVEGVRAFVQIIVNLTITVQRAEIEVYLGITDVSTATVQDLNDAIRAIALSKANSVLTQP